MFNINQMHYIYIFNARLVYFAEHATPKFKGNMNHSELETFVAVAELQSTSAAAEQLHVSQPAVTRRIQSLESALDASLFDRIGKRLHLNHAGKIFLPQAESILRMWMNSQRQLKDLADTVAGSLQLATSHHIGLHRLAPVLAKFCDSYPDVQLNIDFEDSEVTHELVREGKIDLAVATLDPKGSQTLNVTPIWHDPLIFVGKQPRRTNLAELAETPCVLPGVSTYTGRIVLDRFRQAGIKLNPMMSTNYLETIHMLVGVGIGWSVLPATMRGDLHELAVDDDGGGEMFRQLGAITHPARKLSNAAEAFLRTVAEFGDQF